MGINRFLSVEEIEDLGGEVPAGKEGEAVQVLVEPELAEEVNQDAATLESVSDAIGQAMNDEAVMASTIANVEGDMSEVSSSEEGEEVDVTVQPEFTADDVENNPMTVAAAANDAVASVESFYNKIAGTLYTKGMGVKNIAKFTGVSISFEDIVKNPYQSYKAAHEGIMESIKVFFVKMKQFFKGLIDKLRRKSFCFSGVRHQHNVLTCQFHPGFNFTEVLALILAFNKEQSVAFGKIFPDAVGLHDIKCDILPIERRGGGTF